MMHLSAFMQHQLKLVALLAALAAVCQAIPIDNGVIGLPEVECGEHNVRLLFRTERAFNGRIFVKGMVEHPECVTTFPNSGASSVVFQLPGGTCNMRRQRRLGPQRGVEQSMTVIISFHDTFITKVDRAYRCTCFYMEADKVVTNRFEVSMLPTTDLVDTAKMPLCTYSVRRGSINGDVVSYARVGDEIFHVWECQSDMFGMLVHSCFVDDGQGQGRFQLLDENGCALDHVILNELQYNPQTNMAYVEAHAFKFADRVTTYFQCAVSLCMLEDGACNGVTPPRCTGRPSQSLSSFNQAIPSSPQNDGPPNQFGGAQPSNNPKPAANVIPSNQPNPGNSQPRPAIPPPPPQQYRPTRDNNDQPKYQQDPFEEPNDLFEDVPSTSSSYSSPPATSSSSATAPTTNRFRIYNRRRWIRDTATQAYERPELLNLDLSAERIMVLDIDDDVPVGTGVGGEEALLIRRPFGVVHAEPESTTPSGQVCVSSVGFGVMLALFIIILTASILVLFIHWSRYHTIGLPKM